MAPLQGYELMEGTNGSENSSGAQGIQLSGMEAEYKEGKSSNDGYIHHEKRRTSQSSSETITETSNWRPATFESGEDTGSQLSSYFSVDASRLWFLFVHTLVSLPAILFNLLPRFVRPGGLQRTKKLHLTSYLDSLRGVAALIVMTFHYRGFGCNEIWLFDQPFFAIFRGGKGMVNVFFVISGYVLSYKMLKQIRCRQFAPLLDTLASVTFRRYLRLYLSSGFATFCSMLLMQTGILVDNVQKQDTLLGGILHWAHDLAYFSDPFSDLKSYSKGTNRSVYLSFLWTIPVEFRGSLIVFGFCAGCCKLSTRNRMICCSILILASYYWVATYSGLFLAGLFIADLSLSRNPSRYLPVQLPAYENTIEGAPSTNLSRRIRVLYSFVLVISIFLLAQPLHGNKLADAYWPWPFLDRLIPNSYRDSPAADQFWLCIGATLLVFALDSYPTLQLPFTSDFMQYIGDLSFGIYVCHGQVLATLYKRILSPARVEYFGSSLWGCVMVAFLTYPVVLWAADLFTRVDTRLVNFGRWLEKRLFVTQSS